MDSKTAQLKAKNELQFWTFIFFLILLIGAGFEYFSLTKPLDEITVVFMSQKTEPVVVQPTTPAEQPATSADQPTASAEPANVQVEEPKNEPESVVVDTNSHAAQELLDYMNEMKQKINDVSFTEPVLEKIEQSQSQNQSAANQPVFEENKIEVYDEEKGVVGVIETVTETSAKAETATDVSEEKMLEESKSVLSEVEAMAQQVLENQEAKEEIENVIQQEQEVAEKAIQAVQERIDAEINVDDGDEKPIVLIPGLQQPQE